MADEERVSFSGDGWRWTGEPINGVLGLHGSVMLLIPSAIATGMVWQFTTLPLFWPFVIFWVVYIALAAYAARKGYTPRDMIERQVILKLFQGRYKV